MADDWEEDRAERRQVTKALLAITIAIALIVVIGIMWWVAGGSEVANPVEPPATGTTALRSTLQ